MTKKELLEKYLIEEVEVLEPQYTATNNFNFSAEYTGKYNPCGSYVIVGLSPCKIRQLNLDKLIDLLVKYVKITDIIKET